MKTVEIIEGIASGRTSARDVCEEALATIGATDGLINAFTCRTVERARAEADAIDVRRARGEVLPPLAGLPYAVKNLFDIEGVTTLAGSKINRTLPPARADAVLVQRLKAAGAVLLGGLNMDEFAYGFTTENTHYGPTRNPHDTGRIAGGSSGGSGAAIAAGQVPLSLGSDTNGSIRVPASLCGVWGLKPTFGRLSRRGTYPFVHSIDHLGPLADSVEGLALAYDAMQGPDPLDPGCSASRIQPSVPVLSQGIAGLRIGVLGGWFRDNAGPAARAAVDVAALTLGASEVVMWPDAEIGRAAAFVITASEGGCLHLDDLRIRPQDFEPLSVDRFISGVLQPVAWYLRAQRFRRVYRDKVNALFRDWDILIAPATPISAPAIGTEWIEVNGTRHPCRPAMGLLTQPVSFAGCPVVAAPTWPGENDGMPIGVQLIAAPWNESLCLRAGKVLQDTGIARLKC
ncbi:MULTISPECIES: 1-carboxybiuret hydrolase subunit AtzE [Pseudomonadota]|uniref:1-carboxybiuret hydrolase subunit AtzE n=6 Tax=Bacteria TaxID=2 RepID=ATZE_PSESD|nr:MULTISPECIES: 1-carboxybiuret hydrolase subunit AtzE [Pseudomonadota]Q936X3.1 RecName: Full=1-carboxybiuret hydrolase subunit AtzE [Pseudomonas sp. ADP]AAK50332.1 biuret hydrolase [Pseudomonas sp. ADP]AKD43372.1 biuret hydrolase [Pseudomonas sp. EGD-AKN5]QOF88447.1 AtzE family amidohydrolase [Pseudomonas sp. ADPe]WLE00921.1 1-carboxybiuret hydrolase subunit AtzE [Agrobacterium leguminum]